jgi:hypothetical protein
MLRAVATFLVPGSDELAHLRPDERLSIQGADAGLPIGRGSPARSVFMRIVDAEVPVP